MTATAAPAPALQPPCPPPPAGCWRQLFEQHQPQLFRLALRHTGNAADADDVVQDVFLSAFRHLDDLRHEAAVSTWLRRITINRCNDVRRHRSRRPARSLDELGEADAVTPAALVISRPSLEPDARCDAAAARACLREAVAMLSDRLRAVATLRFLHECPLEEIARRLDLSLGTVKSRLHRARTALLQADAMAPWLGEERERRVG